MRRREFITLLGGAAAWPLTARGQQPGAPLIGTLYRGLARRSRTLSEAWRRLAML
jgi:hypothetical protein